MNEKSLKKIKRELEALARSPQNRNYKDFVSLAKQLGRTEDKRGKEPTFVRLREPALSPPLSIPKHSGDMKIGTARSIIEALLSDVDDWEIYMSESEDKDNEKDTENQNGD